MGTSADPKERDCPFASFLFSGRVLLLYGREREREGEKRLRTLRSQSETRMLLFRQEKEDCPFSRRPGISLSTFLSLFSSLFPSLFLLLCLVDSLSFLRVELSSGPSLLLPQPSAFFFVLGASGPRFDSRR